MAEVVEVEEGVREVVGEVVGVVVVSVSTKAVEVCEEDGMTPD